MILVYPMGIPAFFFVTLYRQKNGIRAIKVVHLKQLPKQIQPLAFLFRNYRHGRAAVEAGYKWVSGNT